MFDDVGVLSRGGDGNCEGTQSRNLPKQSAHLSLHLSQWHHHHRTLIPVAMTVVVAIVVTTVVTLMVTLVITVVVTVVATSKKCRQIFLLIAEEEK